ncbi:hypothetical protein VZC37_14010 [Gordonia sp. LSe1-13]|uniref:Uncharacterized protein n=1 Tax=Gordonia sesuvii TaxID=3116777 RepID=A0ABU7MEB5_9ACTN|nr:hypothetical protein [Gordonia sp. LSe1-13]
MSVTNPAPVAVDVGRPGWRIWNLAAVSGLTAYSAGVAWQAQFVSYPLYRAMSSDEFPAYHLAYNHAIPGVVIVPVSSRSWRARRSGGPDRRGFRNPPRPSSG